MGDSIWLRKLTLSLSIILIIFLTTVIFNSTQSFYKAFALGKYYFDKSQYQKAVPYFVSALRISPCNTRAARYLLWTYEKLCMKAELKEVADAMLRCNPKDPRLLLQLADSYYWLSDYKAAEDLYHRLSAEKPDFDVERKLAEVLSWQKKYDEAIPLLERLVKNYPQNFELTELLADVCSWAKKYDRSVELYRKLMASGYGPKENALKLADALRYAGRNAEAVEVYNKYLGK